jgi:membrane-associated phospholipid phosphatase
MTPIEKLLIFAGLLMPLSGLAQSAPGTDEACDVDTDPACVSAVGHALATVGAYVSAPVHWGGPQWLEFGGAMAAIAAAHAADSRVRNHFVGSGPGSINGGSKHTLQDALPAAALLVGTWGYAHLLGDSAGFRETGTMVEAAVLSVGTAYVLNFAAGRLGPDETTHPNRWTSGGRSFPSEHTTAAFAIGTVLAESGNDQYRWVRRVLGYGVGGFTLYERLHHDAHWLSDGVAGAALGAASAQFAMNQRDPKRRNVLSNLSVAPLPGGWLLSYSVALPN